ncbi:MAG: DNA-directed RNA polymerase subunit beta'' [Candidatus Melainabacteria bacterium]|nr:DNA-directed RNA polymerase subunit beta'' [Candidatus Melainabacteria bacterium]
MATKTRKQHWERKGKKPAFINQTVDKKAMGKLLAHVYENYGNDIAARLGNNLKNLGFKYATKASVTISIADLQVPPAKKGLLQAAEDELSVTTQRFERGEITEVERYNKVIDTWSETNEKVTEAVVDHFDRLNPVYMMAFSGARGSISQVRQLVGMRGLMADSEGKIIDLPIKSNFREGLSVPEYMISAYGARKGLVDTALKTADSGYLTRRLVDVAQDVIIRSEDCGTKSYVVMGALMDGDTPVVPISSRVIGRNTAEQVKNPETGEVIAKKGQLITRVEAEAIQAAGIKEVKIRSVLSCESKYGVCKACYGWSTTDNKHVNLGEAIGIIAAQSIGEPGTQLTMRTFHTGGAVAGSGKSRDVYTAPAAGEVSYDFATREMRTKYGDIVYQSVKAGKLKVGSKSLEIGAGAKLAVKPGDKVEKDQYLGDAPESSKKVLTEKASKDVITLQSGQVEFTDFGVDETTDRQGNISKQANKQGSIWVQAGEVLPIPTGGKVTVDSGSKIKKGQTLAETVITCDNDGEVRYGSDVLIEETKIGDRAIKKLLRGRMLNVINASIGAANATIEHNQQGINWVLKDESERYVIKVVNNEMIENGKILAELVDDQFTPTLPCSGEIRYDGVVIDDRKIVTEHGRVIFIPEEIHVLSKDASLVNNKTGDFVTAGTEVVKDVHSTIDGIVRVTIENNIVHEVTITPGELFDISDPSALKFEDGDIVKKGVEVIDGVKTKKPSMVTLFADEETGETKLLLREVQLFDITPRTLNFESETTDADIAIVPVTQMNYKDGDRVRNISGGPLTKTSLILYCKDKYKESKGIIEIGEKDFNIVFQENIILRTDRNESTITEIMVEPGDFVKGGTPVARAQTLANSDGEIFYSESDKYRILVQTVEDVFTLDTKAKPKVKEGDYLLAGDKLDASTTVPESAKVLAVDGNKLTLRKAQPFLVSIGTRLHVDNQSLVNQGDQLATIIYERLKTGDIVQGLPKVEELLEGRKPKEPSIVATHKGKVEIVTEDGIENLFIVDGDDRNEVVIPPGQNIIVNTGDEVNPGDVLTDGQPNPHELLEFKGLEHTQQFLVDEVQSVYISQGVEIANKHIEVIVRQMTRKVKVDEPGDSELLQGEMHERYHVDRINEQLVEDGKEKVSYTSVLLGLTKASLNTESFISAASFQETTRILAEASIKGKLDWLHGLKENVIIGRLIPSGTGFDPEVDGDEALRNTDGERAELAQAI